MGVGGGEDLCGPSVAPKGGEGLSAKKAVTIPTQGDRQTNVPREAVRGDKGLGGR